MDIEVQKIVFDLERAIDLIQQFTKGKNLTDYRNDPMLRQLSRDNLRSSGKR